MFDNDIEIVTERALVFVRLLAVVIMICTFIASWLNTIDLFPAFALFATAFASFLYIDWVAAVLDSEPFEND